MYENIKKAIAAYEAENVAKFRAEIEKKTAGEIVGSWYYRERTTPRVYEALKACEPDAKPAAELIEKIIAKHARKEAKNTAARLAKLAAAEAAAVAPAVDVTVEWHRSRVWGLNPSATVRGWAKVTHGHASGCGYDKESAAIAGAMNDNPEILRILYDHAETGEAFPYSVHTFAGMPSFNGGCGVSCFRAVFEACGYEWRQVASGKTFAAYTLTKNEA